MAVLRDDYEPRSIVIDPSVARKPRRLLVWTLHMAFSATDQFGRQWPIMPKDSSLQRCFAEEHALSSGGRTAPGVLGRGNWDYKQEEIRADQRTHYPAEAGPSRGLAISTQ
jgi:hypothetical protein